MNDAAAAGHRAQAQAVGKRNAGQAGVASASPRSATVVADAETKGALNVRFRRLVAIDVTTTWRRCLVGAAQGGPALACVLRLPRQGNKQALIRFAASGGLTQGCNKMRTKIEKETDDGAIRSKSAFKRPVVA